MTKVEPAEPDEALRPTEAEAIKPPTIRSIEEEMKTSYMDYSMSVIVGRALPDARDGLKPVHRRILYSMKESGIVSKKPYKKSARIVGDVLGKYHPHGDTAVYDTMVRMAQDFSLRYPLVDGQGNFGSVDGDSAAAMRYTESRLAKIAEEMLVDIKKETVAFRPNYDGSLEEPVVLPSKLPNLLVNGSSGIAVGMATNMPPHNLGEVVDATIALIDDPDLTIADLFEYVRGPDFPTGGLIYGINGIYSAYTTGRGHIKVRARTELEDLPRGRQQIIVTELPYQVNKAKLIEKIADLVRQKRIKGITDLRDESDRKGMRIVVVLRRDAIVDVVLNQLFAHTACESTFGVINLALIDEKPRVLTLKQLLQQFIAHREEVVRKRTAYDLRRAKDRAHVLKGYLIALDALDEVIALIRAAEDVQTAKNGLMEQFALSEMQADAVLKLRLRKLTGMERDKIRAEYSELLETIAHLEAILADIQLRYDIICDELRELKEQYNDERRTEILENVVEIDYEDLIPEEDVVITITNQGYIKRIPVDTYQQQHRGGIGKIGMQTKEEDMLYDLFVTSTHNYILIFTNKGKVYWLKGYRIPMGGRQAKGKPIVNLLPELAKDERVKATIPVEAFQEGYYLNFATKNGIIKKTDLSAYSRPRTTGIWAIKLDSDDELIEIRLTDGTREIILATANGQAVRFEESEVRPIGRYTRGVRGVRLVGDDEVMSMAVVADSSQLFTLTEHGYGKRSLVRDYRKTHRGAKGVINIKTNRRNGKVVEVREVDPDDELIVTSKHGMIIRIPVNQVSLQGRNTMGVRVMRLRKGDTVVATAKLVTDEDEGEGEDDGEGDGEERKKEEEGGGVEKAAAGDDEQGSESESGTEGEREESGEPEE